MRLDSKREKQPIDDIFHRLFIIGNGFDTAHGYKTKYHHFRLWMEEELKEAYPDLETDEEGHIVLDEEPDIPFVTMDNHGEDIPDRIQSIYMLMWMLLQQMKSDADWNRFEEELYYLNIESVINTNDWAIEDNARDKEGDINPFHADADYSEMASNIQTAVRLLPKLFEKWIEDIDISAPPKPLFGSNLMPIGQLMDEDSLYLTFNYTETLEKVYKIPGYLVDHIHGLRKGAEKYFNASSGFPNTVGKIIVGHGCDESRDFDAKYIGRESILQETIRELRKPVDRILREHTEFWSWIYHGDVKEVYSFGFSYADVDMEYISQIVVSLKKFDDRPDDDDPQITVNEKFEGRVRACGFEGKFGRYE